MSILVQEIIVAIIVLSAVVWVIIKIWPKKNNRRDSSSCGCGCGDCPLSKNCSQKEKLN